MALELVGGACLEAIFGVLFGRIASPEVVNFFKRKKLNERSLKMLKIKLLAVNFVLNDAEEKQMRNAAVKEWLDELMDVAYDADDLLDGIYSDAMIAANKVRTLSSFLEDFHEKEVENQMENILERLEFMIKQKQVLDLKADAKVKFPHKTPTSSVIEASDVYGRDSDKEFLVQLLLLNGEKDDNVCVIPIVGMGGIGKTTLAQLVYNDDRVQKEFDVKAWVYVSEEFDICKITKTLLEAITLCSHHIEDLNSLQTDLKVYLTKKRFLLVLDDVWNENYDDWDMLISPFKKVGSEGSKIVVTTRSRYVSSIMQTVQPYYLRELSNEDSWHLFAKHAFGFGYRDSSGDPVLEKIGKKIVKKCNGLPLAVKTLAGLLRSQHERRQWHKVLTSEIWDLHDHRSNILPALRLSYHFLPSYLKRCFAYCSIFPKDYEFEKEKLILLWMAEGLLQSESHKRIEEVGDGYFCELVSRSFFQESRRKKSNFVMHHLVNDLAKFISGSFCVRLEGTTSNEVEERTRHLSHVITHGSSHVNFKDTIVSKANRLRTILLLGLSGTPINLFGSMPVERLFKLRYLRVLSLVGEYYCKLPDSVGELKHLRYLELSNAKIVRLPLSICGLYNLQTLKLVGCHDLIELPRDMHKLINLRHLDITGTRLKWMPKHMSRLRNIQNLTDFFIGEGNGSMTGELGKLPDLHGSLFIHNIGHVIDSKDCVDSKLMKKNCLEKLYLDWGRGGDTEDSRHEKKLLDCLRPHNNLKELGIYNYPGTEFSEWLGAYSLCNLVSLQLKGCKYCYKLPPLGQLSSLKDLRIINFSGLVSVGSEFHGIGNFPALEILRFENMSAWENWCLDSYNEGEIGFPHLREIHIECCPRLTGDFPGNLRSLTLLKIRDCKELRCSVPVVPTLRTLIIQNCGSLRLPVGPSLSLSSIYLHRSCDSLKLFYLNLFPHLKSLDILGCKNLEALVLSRFYRHHPPLLSLSISDCPKFISLPFGRSELLYLSWLSVSCCKKLRYLPKPLHHHMPFLKEVHLGDCPEIESIPCSEWPTNLRSVSIWNCKKFKPSHMKWSSSCLTDLAELTTFRGPATFDYLSRNWSPYVINQRHAASDHPQRK